jgi:adenosylcobinamide kinase/adenosylcobinamide-phosphate guanylyltransferase
MKLVFITGGARSGKSSFALKEASKARGQKAYIATAEALDGEMKDRIEKHKLERGDEWSTYEEQIRVTDVLVDLKGQYGAVLLDCLTLWLSNVLLRAEMGGQEHQTPEENIDEFIACLNGLAGAGGYDLYMVSNEVGMGIVPENKLARKFRDLAGTLNRKVAQIADEVYLVTAGIPLKIK